jgi:putative spermidine/putrescine transport system permease protein
MVPYLKLLPALLPFVVFFAGGIGVTLFQSFGMMNPLVHYDSIWAAYKIIITHGHFTLSILFSLYVALVSSFLAIVIGTVLAYTIWKLPPAMAVKTMVYKIPIILPHIAVAFITMIFLSRSGIISSICHSLGIISGIQEFPNLIFSRYGIGEIAAYTAKECSFVTLMAMSVLVKFDRRYLETARQLGAGRMRIFFLVVLPQLREILVTTFLILFIYSFGAFEIPYILGTANPGMLSLQVYNYYFMHDLSERPVAMALLVIMFLICALLAVVYFQISYKLGHKHNGSDA